MSAKAHVIAYTDQDAGVARHILDYSSAVPQSDGKYQVSNSHLNLLHRELFGEYNTPKNGNNANTAFTKSFLKNLSDVSLQAYSDFLTEKAKNPFITSSELNSQYKHLLTLVKNELYIRAAQTTASEVNFNHYKW